MLEFLEKLPFDAQAIQQSRISKKIKMLSKQLAALLEAGKDNPAATWLQAAVSKLMKVWQEKDTKIREAGGAKELPDPFATLKAKVSDRLKDLDKYKADFLTDEPSKSMPDWLKKVHAACQKLKAASKASASVHWQSTSELTKQERDKERAILMKQDLKKAQAERQEILRKLA
jgi:hypothetical protein